MGLEDLYFEYMSNGNEYKKLAEKFEARDESGLARINYSHSLKWFKKALILITSHSKYEKHKHQPKIEKYVRDAEWECNHCNEKIEMLNGHHTLNRL